MSKVKTSRETKPVHKYRLFQKDFEDGTYRIRKPGIYILQENINFEPNAQHDYFPTPNQKNYEHPAYHLGFFAAITVECPRVIIDLNGFTLQQSKVHALLQRFYANIELANTPFIQGQGPGNFGPMTGSADNCVIMNGFLGRSSHHGIHGNNVRNVLLENLTISDFEVAGVAINGFDGVKMRNVEVGFNRRDVPVQSFYAAGRYIQLICKPWLQANGKLLPDSLRKDYQQKLDNLDQELLEVLNAVRSNKPVPSSNFFAMPPTGDEYLPDGNNYGLLFHVPGVAIMDYIEETTQDKLSKNLELDKVKIHGIRARPVEILAISTLTQPGEEENVQADVSGTVFMIQGAVNKLEENGAPRSDAIYKPNVLTEVQLVAAEACFALSQSLGRMSITQDLITWAKEKLPFSYLTKKGYKLFCNGDLLFHVQKGVHGIRADGLVGAKLTNVMVKKISNVGPMGSAAVGHYQKSHTAQQRIGYRGTDVSAISLSYVHRIFGKHIHVERVHSDNGTVRGYRFINESRDVKIIGATIKDINNGYEYEDGCWYGINYRGEKVLFNSCLPNLIPMAFGVCIEIYDDQPSKHIKFEEIKISGVSGVSGCSLDYAWQTIHDAN